MTATPRSVTAPRQASPFTLQKVRDAPAGEEQVFSAFHEAAMERPTAHETPVTRIAAAAGEPPPQLFALTPIGAPPCGAFEVVAGSAPVPVPSSEDPHPAIAENSAATAIRSDIDRAILIGPAPI